MKNNTAEVPPGGFWIRFFATWLDFLLIYAILMLFFYFLLFFSVYVYFPFAFTYILLFILYSTVSVAVTGQTAGKWLLNIRVANRNGERASVLQSLARESVLKILSGLVLFLGYVWIGVSRDKRGFHDRLSGTKVIKVYSMRKGTAVWQTVSFVSFIFLAGSYLSGIFGVLYSAIKMGPSSAAIELPFIHRDPSTIVDLSTTTDDTVFDSWLDKNAQSPSAYAVRIAGLHQVTIFGETHGIKDYLVFFNGLIDSLYYAAGIRVIGMEVIASSLNEKVDNLVTCKEYNDALQLEIARSQGWKAWGEKEYWDVLKTVWKLNQSLPVNARKMRVIGLDDDWEGANITLLNIGGDRKGPTPFSEKFRAFPAIKDLVNVTNRDALMARHIEKEIIQKGDKGVVLVGSAHSLTQFGRPFIRPDKILAINSRMGLLLSRKYKDQVFQIVFFQSFSPEETNAGCPPLFQGFIESVMDKRDTIPAGFSIKNSPFENLRDSCSEYFDLYPSVCLGDLVQGLIFLKPLEKLESCTWTRGYISNEMYMKYKPLYELMTKRKFSSAGEADNYFGKRLENPK